MQEMTFIIGPDRRVSELWTVLGEAGITQEASCTFPTVDGRNVRTVVQDADAKAARRALLDAGFGPLDTREVLILDIEVRPGELGRLAQRITDVDAQLTTLYMATGNRVVVGADDLNKVRHLA